MAQGLFWASVLFVVFLATFGLDKMGIISSKNHFPVDGRTILITGGSQGMGRALGKLLASKGANVVIVARDRKKLEAALEYISVAALRPSQRFHYISADVTSAEENERILAETAAWNDGQPPDIVWANAGMSIPALFLDTSIATLRQQMDINYFAAAYLAHSTLATWLKPSPSTPANSLAPRHFIITSSVAGFVNFAGYSPYAPSKAALRSLADGLRSELNLYNGARRASDATPATVPPADVQIHAVFPGTITTPGYEMENLTKHPVTKQIEEADPVQTEDEVAIAAVKGLERGGYLITTQWLGMLMKGGAMSGSPRTNLLWDTLLAWVTAVAWLFIAPDMESKVWKWGKENGIGKPVKQ